MNGDLLILENYQQRGSDSPDMLCRQFRADGWLRVGWNGRTARILEAGPGVSPLIRRTLAAEDPFHFYRELLSNVHSGTVFYRLRTEGWPFDAGIPDEVESGFPRDRFDYVLSTAEECGLTGYFLERINRAALESIAETPCRVMPPGYLNGMIHERSGRHWFSLALRQRYLRDRFEALYDSPRYIAVNAVAECNYQCRKCQYNSPLMVHKRQAGRPMSLHLYREFLEKCREYGQLKSIAPTITGEPLLHPDIASIVGLTKKAGYSCSFATNASLLTREAGIRLLDAGIDGLAFSIDSIKPSVYRALQGGDLAAVERNILVFQEESMRRTGSFSGTMICVVSKENEQEVEEYRETWRKRGFTVFFSAEHDIRQDCRPYFHHDRWAPPQRMPCFALWLGLYLTEEGRTVSCGSTARKHGFGRSIFEVSPSSLWRSKALQMLRERQLSGTPPRYCRSFSCWTGQMSTWVHENGRLVNHTQASWMEPPESPQGGEVAKHGWKQATRRMLSGVKKRLAGH